MNSTYENLKRWDLSTLREEIRAGRYQSHTAGLGQGYLQANLVILPESHALDFMRFCQRNPKACPLTGVSDTGNPRMTTLGHDLDIRTDIPAYNIYRHGVVTESVTDISGYWREDLVAFALGCSFTFEHAIRNAGISFWHIDNNKTVPMFRTGIETTPAGPFRGKMVVSMRAVSAEKIECVNEISSRFPLAHGAPVYWGNPEKIGITDLSNPDWGDASPVAEGEVPVFWACGVTPQVAIEAGNLPLCITHKPGHMLITDIAEDAEVPVISFSPPKSETPK